MKKIKVRSGNPLILGNNKVGRGINFAIFIKDCRKLSLCLFAAGDKEPAIILDLDPQVNRHGDIWHILLEGDLSAYSYAYKVYTADGSRLALDPYAKYLSGGEEWGHPHKWLGGIVDNDFDWQGDRLPRHPMAATIIYELHLRGFSRHQSSGVRQPGTYLGLVEKIPYLKELGITAVELLPVHEFDENDNPNFHPERGTPLKNFWGYSTLAFFAPKAAYAARPVEAVQEFKTMVRELHRAGIEVILDVVFNHTGEGDDERPMASFRALAESTYYMKDPLTGEHQNFTGCGNTLNCNHPVVRRLIIDCLRYWAVEMHIDGFRFDLAAIFSRGSNGEVIKNPPLIEDIATDPVLKGTKLIAEAWDAAGLYQVGSFSNKPQWWEWNGRFRDDVRAFLCGHDGCVSRLATRLAGSADLYRGSGRKPCNSVNFITSHDGFTLHDLMSYDEKHNYENGEENRDGENHNISWNSGEEGESRDDKIILLRESRVRMAALILFLSQGTPMLLAGDEFGRSQGGNNNAYCQDNEISWLNWELAERNGGLLRFFRLLIRLRKRHKVFQRQDFFDPHGQEVIWQGLKRGKEDWSADARVLCFMLTGKEGENDFFVALNGDHNSHLVELPLSVNGEGWRLIVDTAAISPNDIVEDEQGGELCGEKIKVRGRNAIVLIRN